VHVKVFAKPLAARHRGRVSGSRRAGRGGIPKNAAKVARREANTSWAHGRLCSNEWKPHWSKCNALSSVSRIADRTKCLRKCRNCSSFPQAPSRHPSQCDRSNATGSLLPPGQNLGLPWQLSVLKLRSMYGDRPPVQTPTVTRIRNTCLRSSGEAIGRRPIEVLERLRGGGCPRSD
jgi:hypothetical protein